MSSDSKIINFINLDDNKISSDINSGSEEKIKVNNFEKIKYKLDYFREKTLNNLTEFFNFLIGLKECFGKYFPEENNLFPNKKNLFAVRKNSIENDNSNNVCFYNEKMEAKDLM